MLVMLERKDLKVQAVPRARKDQLERMDCRVCLDLKALLVVMPIVVQ